MASKRERGGKGGRGRQREGREREIYSNCEFTGSLLMQDFIHVLFIVTLKIVKDLMPGNDHLSM